MKTQLLNSSLILEALTRRAKVFAKKLPQPVGAKRRAASINLTFIIDEEPPVFKDRYGKLVIDRYAIAAYNEIFAWEDEIDLLFMDTSLVLTVLFWDGLQLSEVNFSYPINDLLLLAETNQRLLTKMTA